MQWRAEREVNEVHVEAGTRLSGGLLQEGYADELLVYMAPMLLGVGMGMYQLPVLDRLDHARRFVFTDVATVGADVRLRARRPESWKALLEAVSG